jgi:hypothetical protein
MAAYDTFAKLFHDNGVSGVGKEQRWQSMLYFHFDLPRAGEKSGVSPLPRRNPMNGAIGRELLE